MGFFFENRIAVKRLEGWMAKDRIFPVSSLLSRRAGRGFASCLRYTILKENRIPLSKTERFLAE
jgi:hypothetical protein